MIDKVPDPPKPRRIALEVSPNGVTIPRRNGHPITFPVGSVVRVTSYSVVVHSGAGFQKRRITPEEEWIASLGMTAEGKFVLAIPTSEGRDGYIIFHESGRYLIGHPDYIRLLQAAPPRRKSSGSNQYVHNKRKVFKRKWA